jgi:plasmid stabilization system protein ParE
MKSTYKIIWSDIAEKDLVNIIGYIAADSKRDALKILNKIKGKISKLYNLPERSRIVPELKAFGIHHYRELIIPPWRIIYRISEDKVYVLSVIDSRQNVEDVLLKRLTNQIR